MRRPNVQGPSGKRAAGLPAPPTSPAPWISLWNGAVASGSVPAGSSYSLGRLLFTALVSAASAAVATTVFFSTWIKNAAPPELYYQINEENLRLLLAVPLLWRSYIPNVFAWNGHVASVFGYVKLPSWSHRRDNIEVITLPDGGTVSIEWGAVPRDGDPIILMLPGEQSPPHAAIDTKKASHHEFALTQPREPTPSLALRVARGTPDPLPPHADSPSRALPPSPQPQTPPLNPTQASTTTLRCPTSST